MPSEPTDIRVSRLNGRCRGRCPTDDGGCYLRCTGCGRNDPRVRARVKGSAVWVIVAYSSS